MAVLVNGSLYFTSAKTLAEADRFEGQATFAEVEAVKSALGEDKAEAVLKFASGDMSSIANQSFFVVGI